MHHTVIRMSDEIWEKLRTLSFTTRESINSIVIKAVVKYMEDVKK